MLSTGRKNQASGATFEAFFAYYSRLEGLLCINNGVQVKMLRGGRAVCMPSNLDWTLITHDGRCAFIDTKAFTRKSFGLSLLNPRQLQLARRYAEHGVISGFVVALRSVDAVCFYSVDKLVGRPRQSFGVDDGVLLGTVSRFSPKRLF